ncbi:uncharacterized protein EDB91DRAFT_1259163 [Suillus paluster]|uniref:uncharacterized protein n=1 Tax=Suillus paluster TaxID=48578 RepID=UPI001B86DCCC|nr:uncharacterized protein EDB91DRAFT_1259163 [Suillus paluster]KAG1717848.1 hypothetical protein EDB91DRAFT_1259163 [Suillus paluster]
MPQSTKRVTCAENASTHPGQIVLDAQPKHRMKAAKAADDRRLQEAQEAKEAEAVAGLTWLAALETDMEVAQTQAQMNKPKAVKPHPRPVGKKKGQGVASKEGGPDIDSGNTGAAGISSKVAVLGEDIDEDFLPSNDNDSEDTLDIQKRRKGQKTTPHQSLKAAIDNARKKTMLESGVIDDDQACAQTNKKGNSLVPVKSSLCGRIQNWRTTIPQKLASSTASQSDSFASAQPPPSTILSRSQKSASSATTSLNSHLNQPSTKLPAVCEDDLALVGAFGDEDLDDSSEHEVVLATKGKVPMKSIVALTEEMDPDLVPPPLAQRQDRAASGTKRKTLHDDVLEFSDCSDDLMSPVDVIEALDSDEDSEIMDVDEFEAVVTKQPVKAKVKVEKAPRTTTSTLVTTTSSKAPPSKKVKAEKEQTATMVLKSDGSWVESVLKACSTYLNTDLPPACHEDTKWGRVFVPTIFLWLGAQEEPWTIPDKNLLHACCEIFKVVYPSIKYQVVTSGSVFGVVTQHVNETFHSAFVLELLTTAHLSRTLGHADVPALNTDNLAQGGFVGALGLCAVLLEHAFSLLSDNAISIENLEDADMPTTAWKTRFKTPKTLNKATGKETGMEHAFSVVKWGMKTAAFVRAAKKKGPEATCLTASMAYKHLKKPGASIDSDDEMDDREDVW